MKGNLKQDLHVSGVLLHYVTKHTIMSKVHIFRGNSSWISNKGEKQGGQIHKTIFMDVDCYAQKFDRI